VENRSPTEHTAPIGVFDSGVGGLTVARELVRRLPLERVLYVADQLHVPYGGRPLEQIRSFATSLSDHLFNNGAKRVVMACNISSATALDRVRERFGADRVLGVIEHGARAAIAATKNGRIGVLATQGTVATSAYTKALHALDPHARVVEIACPRFVPLIEKNELEGAEAEDAAHEYLGPLLAASTDTIILGCTHYPFLSPLLERLAKERALFVDPACATVDALARNLAERGSTAEMKSELPHRLATTGDVEIFRNQLKVFWPDLRGEVSVEHLTDAVFA
jgi:glutamate racemase